MFNGFAWKKIMFFHGCRIAILRICLLGGVAKYNLIPPYTGLKKVAVLAH